MDRYVLFEVTKIGFQTVSGLGDPGIVKIMKHVWQGPSDGDKTPAHHLVSVPHPSSLKALALLVQEVFVLLAPMNQ